MAFMCCQKDATSTLHAKSGHDHGCVLKIWPYQNVLNTKVYLLVGMDFCFAYVKSTQKRMNHILLGDILDDY